MENTITFELPAPFVWGTVTLASLMLASWFVYISLPTPKNEPDPVQQFQARFGAADLHPVVFFSAITLWTALAIVLIVGLFGLIFQIVTATEVNSDYLFYVLRIAGLTTVLGAVIALPFTLIRLDLTQKQTRNAEESLFNEKINAATQGLYAQRKVTMGNSDNGVDQWQDDLIQRNAAIDRLEGLARERTLETPRVLRLLTVYIRELSTELRYDTASAKASDITSIGWVPYLSPIRSDIENAAQSYGRLKKINADILASQTFNLSGGCLAGCELAESEFSHSVMNQADLSGATLNSAVLRHADLWQAKFDGAYLRLTDFCNANMDSVSLRFAFISKADFDSASLLECDFTGAYLISANFASAKEFRSVTAIGSAFRECDLTKLNKNELTQELVNSFFADLSTTLPEKLERPPFWPNSVLETEEFHERWRIWQATLPTGWDAPKP